uniref:Helitron helicase-like domain-containing protein n=1 Tax=Lactuca sativa TaxID=4236 RepID=A0A9R1X9T2_LACSA|nr:hypothetical protein LSAT_V11C500239480 [Lactuca sativa]
MMIKRRLYAFQEDLYDFVYKTIPMEHLVLKAHNPCVHCGAKRIQFEFPTFCCMSGKTKLAYSPIPTELLQLFTKQDRLEEVFRYNIRAYNSKFSFTSLGVKVDKELAKLTFGVYTFCVHRTFYHNIDQLIPREGEPKYLQLYFYDGQNELSERAKHPNVDRKITEKLARILSSNPYVAGIWVEGNDNITAYKRSIIVYGRSGHTRTIQPLYGSYDLLSYHLFFPNGESGWHPKIPRQGVSIDDIITESENADDDLEGIP